MSSANSASVGSDHLIASSSSRKDLPGFLKASVPNESTVNIRKGREPVELATTLLKLPLPSEDTSQKDKSEPANTNKDQSKHSKSPKSSVQDIKNVTAKHSEIFSDEDYETQYLS